MPDSYLAEPSPAEPPPNRVGRSPTFYPALDGYRALAVLLVFSVHYLSTQLPYFSNWGFVGVDFFFVLSGFLITGILYDSRDATHRMRDFYARRALRIFPLYYSIGLLALASWPIFRWQFHPAMWLWVGHLGNWGRYLSFHPADPFYLDLLQASRHANWFGRLYFGHFWSLCVEEQFYLLWPLVVFAVRSRIRLIAISAAAVIVEPMIRAVLWYRLPPWLLHSDLLLRGTVFRLDALLIGGLIALLLRGPNVSVFRRYSRLISVALAIPLPIVIIGYRLRHGPDVSTDYFAIVTFGFTAASLFGAALLLELIHPASPLARFFTWRPLARLGQISYGFYVFHDLFHDVYNWLAGLLFHGILARYFCAALFAFIGTTVLSYISFRFFETPFLRLKSRFPNQVHSAPAS